MISFIVEVIKLIWGLAMDVGTAAFIALVAILISQGVNEFKTKYPGINPSDEYDLPSKVFGGILLVVIANIPIANWVFVYLLRESFYEAKEDLVMGLEKDLDTKIELWKIKRTPPVPHRDANET